MALKNYQYQEIMAQYDRRQLANKQLQTLRKTEVYQAIPRIEEIEREISTTAVRQARLIIDGNLEALTDLKRRLNELAAEKRRLLVENQFDSHYIDPVYTCPDCKDTGYIEDKKCHCFVQATIDLLYQQSHLKEILQEENFNAFCLEYYSAKTDDQFGHSPRQAASKALNAAKEFIKNFSYDCQNLLLTGNTGIGKTFLTNCIAKELLEQSFSVVYFSASKLFDQLANVTFSKNEINNNSIYDDIIECDLLIIDDLGTELTNSFVASQLFNCINERFLSKKATIISTNLSLQAIREKYSERIFSRLSLNYALIKLFGDDIRIKKRLATLDNR